MFPKSIHQSIFPSIPTAPTSPPNRNGGVQGAQAGRHQRAVPVVPALARHRAGRHRWLLHPQRGHSHQQHDPVAGRKSLQRSRLEPRIPTIGGSIDFSGSTSGGSTHRSGGSGATRRRPGRQHQTADGASDGHPEQHEPGVEPQVSGGDELGLRAGGVCVFRAAQTEPDTAGGVREALKCGGRIFINLL